MVYTLDTKSATYSFRCPSTTALNDIRFALDARIPKSAGLLLAHLLKSPDTADPEFILSVLAGVVRGLPDILAAHKLSIAKQPYRAFAVETMRRFIGCVLGLKPVASVSLDDLKTIGCGCYQCVRYFVWFFGSPQQIEYVSEK